MTTETDILNFADQLIKLKKDNSNLLTSYKNLETNASELKIAFKNNLSVLANKDSDYKKLKNSYETNVSKNKALTVNLQKSNFENSQLKLEIEALEKSIKNNEDEIKQYKEKIENFDQILEKEKKSVEENSKSDFDKQVSDIKNHHQTEILKLQTEISNITKSHLQKQHEMEEKFNNERSILQQKCENYNLVCASEEKLLQNYKELQSHVTILKNSHENEINEFQRVIDNSDQILEQAEEKIETLMKNFEKKKITIETNHSNVCKDYENTVASLSSTISEKENQIKILKDYKLNFENEQAKNQLLQNSIDKNQHKLDNYIERDKIAASNFAKLTSEKSFLTESVKKLNQKNEKISEENAKFQRMVSKFDEILLKMGVEKMGKNFSSDNENESEISIILSKMSSVENLMEDNKKLNQKYNDQHQKFQLFREKYDALNHHITTINDKNKITSSEIDNLKKLTVNLKNELSSKNIECENLLRSKKEMENKIRTLENLHGTSEKQKMWNDSTKSDLIEKLSKSIGFIEQLSQENEYLKSLNNRLIREAKRGGGTEETDREVPSRSGAASSGNNSHVQAINPMKTIRTPNILPKNLDSISLFESIAPKSDLWEPLNF